MNATPVIFTPDSETTATSVVSLADAKSFLRVDTDADDALITSLLQVAVNQVQNYTGYYLQQITGVFRLKAFYDTYLPAGPLVSVSDVTYPVGNEFTSFYTETRGPSPFIHFDSPPALDTEVQFPVVITCTVGNNTPPAGLVHAVKLLVNHYYDNRETIIVGTTVSRTIPEGIKSLIAPYKNIYFQ